MQKEKTNLSWRRFLAIPGVFPYPVLVFHNAVSTLFLLLRWKSHNGRYWLLYFLSVYPPLAFVIAEQEDMPDRGAMLSLQNLNIFFLIIWNPVGSRGGIQEGRCRGSECLPLGLVGGREGGGCKVPDHQVCSGYVKGEHHVWSYLGKRVKYAVWSARAR